MSKDIKEVKVESAELDVLKGELDKLRAELVALRTEKKQLGETAVKAVVEAREEMILDEEVGPLYISDELLDDNFVYRKVDTSRAGRVQKFLKMGYEVVHDDKIGETQVGDNKVTNNGSIDTAVRMELGADNVHRAGILMRIPKDRYEKRQKAKARMRQEDSDDRYQSMANNSHSGSISIGDKVYSK